MITFHFYPTLLNEYHRFLKNQEEEAFEKLFRRINRIPEKDPVVLARFSKGIRFEDAVLKNKASEIDQKLIKEAQNLLPKKRKTQQLLSFMYGNIRFYGYADVVGEAKVIDLKQTSKYRQGMHQFNFQNLYLYALKDAGFNEIQYIICDSNEIFVENYMLKTYDFEPLLAEMNQFSTFLLENRKLIKDHKIIQEQSLGSLFE